MLTFFQSIQDPVLGMVASFISIPAPLTTHTTLQDYDPATGPSDSFTIHGLWPDHCDGTFDANCDASREVGSVRSILQAEGKTDLLAYME